MGLFSKKNEPTGDREYRGGCSVHDMRGPARKTRAAAEKDTYAHGKRMHGGPTFYGGYVERRK